MFSTKQKRGKKQRSLRGVGQFAARKAHLMTKLLNRHKRIPAGEESAGGDQKVDGLNNNSESSHSRNSAPPKKKNAVKNIMTRGLRRKREEVARTASPTNISTWQTPPSTSPQPPDEVALFTDPTVVSPLDEDANFPSMMIKRAASFTPFRRPLDREHELHDVAVLSSDLTSDFNAEDPEYHEEHHDAPRGKPRVWIVLTSVAAVGICAASMFFLSFSILPTIACIVTIALSVLLIPQNAALNVFDQLKVNNHVIACEDEAWKMANSHLQLRCLAANTVLLRGHVVKMTLDELIREKSGNRNKLKSTAGSSFRRSAAPKPPSKAPLSAAQVVAVHKQWAKNVEEIERRKRNEVLLIVSKALLVSNKQRSSQTVLNSLGLEIMISRLKKLDGIDFDPEDFHQLLEQYGHTEQALHTLYQLIMDKSSKFIEYDVMLRQTSNKR